MLAFGVDPTLGAHGGFATARLTRRAAGRVRELRDDACGPGRPRGVGGRNRQASRSRRCGCMASAIAPQRPRSAHLQHAQPVAGRRPSATELVHALGEHERKHPAAGARIAQRLARLFGVRCSPAARRALGGDACGAGGDQEGTLPPTHPGQRIRPPAARPHQRHQRHLKEQAVVEQPGQQPFLRGRGGAHQLYGLPGSLGAQQRIEYIGRLERLKLGRVDSRRRFGADPFEQRARREELGLRSQQRPPAAPSSKLPQ
jgi:hypothetical protein